MGHESFLVLAKCVDTDALVYGFPVFMDGGTYFIYTGESYSDGTSPTPVVHSVIGSTIHRCTGHKDIHGELIFEGHRIRGFNMEHQRWEEYTVQLSDMLGWVFIDDSGKTWGRRELSGISILRHVLTEGAVDNA